MVTQHVYREGTLDISRLPIRGTPIEDLTLIL